jgi:hypothetical protein
MTSARLVFLLVVSALGVACTSSSGGSTSSGSGGSGGAATFCPSSPPSNGTPCSSTDLSHVCEYGGDAHTRCTTRASCFNGAWLVDTPDPACEQQPAACPASLSGVAQGTLCSLGKDVCVYPEGLCGCAPCREDGGVGAIWECGTWTSAGDACPSPRPLFGAACAIEGAECDYGQCCGLLALGPSMKCVGGTWAQWTNGGCACNYAACP